MSSREEGPVYYREIQKNAYLKRIPSDAGSKLRPLGSKKPPLKAMWTLLCVHNGRTPYLEQYPAAEGPAAAAHRPVWRASLATARHVTASVKPHTGEEYDFLVDCDHGAVRMLAPDWDSMQDWVCTLRAKLHELRIVAPGENVYCAPPAAAPPRAPARDPTSPLPPTPPVPVPRVPGIELTTTRTVHDPEQPATSTTETQQPQPQPQPEITEPVTETIDISNWDAPLDSNNSNLTSDGLTSDVVTSLDAFSQPSTSQDSTAHKQDSKETKTRSVAKICGQNICLDDSILKRNKENTESDEEFFAEIDRIHDSVESLQFEEHPAGPRSGFRQTLMVDGEASTSHGHGHSDHQPSNITVIKVSNKPPHTAIPVLGPETDIFDFAFKQHLTVNNDKNLSSASQVSKQDDFVNIVNTEVNVRSSEGGENGYGTGYPDTGSTEYGTVFSKEPEYGHISLTTTVSLTGDVKVIDGGAMADGIYERLCLASTSSNKKASPTVVKKLRSLDIVRKSSLPNLDTKNNSESTYEYLYPKSSLNNTNITLNSTEGAVSVNGVLQNDERNTESSRNTHKSHGSTSTEVTRSHGNSNAEVSRSHANSNVEVTRSHGNSNAEVSRSHANSNAEVSRSHGNSISEVTRSHGNSNTEPQRYITSTVDIPRNIANASDGQRVTVANNSSEITNRQNNSQVTVNHVDTSNGNSTRRGIVERSHSQNAFDSAHRLRDHLIRRVQNHSPKQDGKSEKPETQKPIWKRGLTELSLLSRLRGIGQRRQESPTRRQESPTRRQESPTRHADDRGVKVVHRSRAEGRLDGSRRRSSSLTNNGQSPPAPASCPLQPLRARQAAALRADQRRGAAVPAAVPKRDPPVFVDYERQVWVAWWGVGGARCGGRAGDRAAYVRGAAPSDSAHARQLAKHAPAPLVDILFHRVPLGKIYVINKRDLESTGIKLDGECNIAGVEPGSPAARAGLPPPGRWAVTEVNNRPINLVKGGEEEMNRISLHGTEVSVLILPAPLVKKIRAALKNKTLFRY